MKLVESFELEEGMILAKDVIWNDGFNSVLLLKAGLPVSLENIERFIEKGVKQVFICNGKYDDVEVVNVIDEKLKKECIKEIASVYSKNALDVDNIGKEAIYKLERTSEELVDAVLANPNIKIGVSELKSMDEYTYHHCLCVSVLSIAIGTALELSSDDLRKLGLAALLHDIGKIEVGFELINKRDKLTVEEYERIQEHPLLGGQFLKRNKLTDLSVYNGVLMHHEKFDGSGYPFKLKGENIPLFGRIIAVADVYDALTSNRPYRPAMLASEAFEYVLGANGTHFDMNIVEAFCRRVSPYPVGSILRLSNDDIVLVIDNQADTPLRPLVSSALSGKMIDLADPRNQNIVVKEVLEDLDFLTA